jgi:hypothetical protein
MFERDINRFELRTKTKTTDAPGSGENLQAIRFAPSVIRKSIKNTSENVLVKFADAGDAVKGEKRASCVSEIGRPWRSGSQKLFRSYSILVHLIIGEHLARRTVNKLR